MNLSLVSDYVITEGQIYESTKLQIWKSEKF